MTDTGHLYKQSVAHGAVYLAASAAVFSCVGAVVKTLSRDLPLEMVVFFRCFGGLVFLGPWLMLNRRISMKTHFFRNHLMRAVFGVGAMYCFFFTIAKLPLAEAISLNFTAPLVIPVAAWLMIGEKLPRRVGLMLAIGFCGVMLIVKPGSDVFRGAAFVGLASALFVAVALVNIRKLTRTEPAIRVVFYFAVIASVITLIPMLRVWTMPEPRHWLLIGVLGAGATLGQWFLTRGYASAPAGQVGYYQYSAVIFAGLIDWMLWGSRPDRISLAGVALICAAGIAVSRTSRNPPPARAV